MNKDWTGLSLIFQLLAVSAACWQIEFHNVSTLATLMGGVTVTVVWGQTDRWDRSGRPGRANGFGEKRDNNQQQYIRGNAGKTTIWIT